MSSGLLLPKYEICYYLTKKMYLSHSANLWRGAQKAQRSFVCSSGYSVLNLNCLNIGIMYGLWLITIGYIYVTV